MSMSEKWKKRFRKMAKFMYSTGRWQQKRMPLSQHLHNTCDILSFSLLLFSLLIFFLEIHWNWFVFRCIADFAFVAWLINNFSEAFYFDILTFNFICFNFSTFSHIFEIMTSSLENLLLTPCLTRCGFVDPFDHSIQSIILYCAEASDSSRWHCINHCSFSKIKFNFKLFIIPSSFH